MLSSADLMKLEFFLPPSGAARERIVSEKFRTAMVMRTPAITVSEHESVERAAELMATHAVHSLPVVSASEHLVGIITTTDIIAAFLQRVGDGNGVAASGGQGLTSPTRIAALEHVAREAERFLNAGLDEQLHASLLRAIQRLNRT